MPQEESPAWVLSLVMAQAVPAPTSSRAFLLLLSLYPACCAMRSLVRSSQATKGQQPPFLLSPRAGTLPLPEQHLLEFVFGSLAQFTGIWGSGGHPLVLPVPPVPCLVSTVHREPSVCVTAP